MLAAAGQWPYHAAFPYGFRLTLHRTRIKICGITRVEDGLAAARLGSDAIGFVFYPKSPRYVAPEQARLIAAAMPPFVTLVGLFVNETREGVQSVLDRVPLQLLQFHGDEPEQDCLGYGLPYIKAARVREGFDLVEYAADFPQATGLVLDAWVEGYGGGGKTFDWALVPDSLPQPLILSGGLDAANVAEGVRRFRPWAVDCSSAVEITKGIKDEQKIADFVAAVRAGDA